MSYMKSGKEDGAKLVYGGDRVGSEGYFVQPTVFADVEDKMSIATDEVGYNLRLFETFKEFCKVE